MPLLPPQRDLFPADLLDQRGEDWQGLTRWVAFYTLARREKELMRKLVAKGIPFYAPLVKRRHRSPAGRVRESFVPLFPGYVFSRVDDDQRRSALATKAVARWLPIGDDDALRDDLRSIKRLIDADVPLTPEARLASGQRVRVRGGPLRDMEGTVIERRGRRRLVVAVRFLNQGASVELDEVELERT
jgi:transcription antitermination factor NusG